MKCTGHGRLVRSSSPSESSSLKLAESLLLPRGGSTVTLDVYARELFDNSLLAKLKALSEGFLQESSTIDDTPLLF